MRKLMSVTGTKESAPLRVGPPVVDYVTGLYAAFAIMAGLAKRDRTGTFQRLDVAMRDCALAMMSSVISAHVNAGAIPLPSGNIAASGSPSSGVFTTADGRLALAANHEGQFRALCAALGRPDLLSDPRFADPSERQLHAADLRRELATVFAGSDAAEWERRLEAGIPAGRVRAIPEAIAEPQTAARGLLRCLASAELGRDVAVLAAPFKRNGAMPRPATAPRPCGADTEAVLRELLDLSPAEIARLREKGVLG